MAATPFRLKSRQGDLCWEPAGAVEKGQAVGEFLGLLVYQVGVRHFPEWQDLQSYCGQPRGNMMARDMVSHAAAWCVPLHH